MNGFKFLQSEHNKVSDFVENHVIPKDRQAQSKKQCSKYFLCIWIWTVLVERRKKAKQKNGKRYYTYTVRENTLILIGATHRK